MQHFTSCDTPAAVKSLYRDLAMQHHPDRGGDTRTMQDINAEYLQALKRLDGHTHTDNGKKFVYNYREHVEQSVLDKISELLAQRWPDDVELWIVGTWLWVKGNTKPHKETLKSLGYRWHSKRRCWYWKPYPGKTFYSGTSFAGLASQYGAAKLENEKPKKRAVLPA